MTQALIVDDLKLDRRLAGSLLEDRTDLNIEYARNGREALAHMSTNPPDLVLTDMQMPKMDGLELVDAMRRDLPSIPVILMTAHGSEDIATEALHRGAAGYVPKRYLSRDLVSTVERVLVLAGRERQQTSILKYLTEVEYRFVIDNNMASLKPLICHLRTETARKDLLDETELTRVSVALDEALSNAIQHGNLELGGSGANGSDRQTDTLQEEKGRTLPYCNRRVRFDAKISRTQATYVVQDEGKGFNVSSLPDPDDPANLDRVQGRGLVLIRTFMDEVKFNDTGNQITMIKRAKA